MGGRYAVSSTQAGGKYSEARYNLGIALLERGQAQAEEREFRLAIEQEKTSWPEAHYNLAQALETSGATERRLMNATLIRS